MTTRDEIKKMAADENMTEIEMVSMLQSGAATLDNEDALEELITIKSEILKEMGY